MAELRFELKKIKLFQGMEGYGLNADLYINGVKCLFIRDAGDGGEIDYDSYARDAKNTVMRDRIVSLIAAMDAHIKTLPAETSTCGNKTFTIKVDRDIFINDLLVAQDKARLKAKNEKKMNALYTHALVIGKPNDNKYRYIDLKRPLFEVPQMLLQSYADKLKRECATTGEVFLNTNLATLSIKI